LRKIWGVKTMLACRHTIMPESSSADRADSVAHTDDTRDRGVRLLIQSAILTSDPGGKWE
jgi:hypothetical protein